MLEMTESLPMTRYSGLHEVIARELAAGGGWLPFDRFMALALYAPGLGYYTQGDRQFGSSAETGSDFVTAPELSPLFGTAFAQQLRQALAETGTREIWEFGAGTGALAAQLLAALGDAIDRYVIVDLSGTLRERQQRTVAQRSPQLAGKLSWARTLPEHLAAVVIGNEVLDAMPVKLVARRGGHWLERGVILTPEDAFAWSDRPTDRRPPLDVEGDDDYLTELHPQAQGFMRTLAERIDRGAAFFIDYGFPEAEYYHPQRAGGTLMCHYRHRADTEPLDQPGDKDITAHVDFTGVALAGQEAGLTVLGYTSQAHFLFNCGLLELLPAGDELAALAARNAALRLVNEHEMGELFKVIGFVKGPEFDAIGFRSGDRSHTL